MNKHEQYEQDCELIRAENRKLLNEFAAWLSAAGLSAATIDRHKSNIEFFVDEYLLYEDAMRPAEGADMMGDFLGYWFIRKAMWASESSIKSNAASLKKFYTFMQERGAINWEALQRLKGSIKEELPEWMATVKRYDDHAVELEDVWQF